MGKQRHRRMFYPVFNRPNISGILRSTSRNLHIGSLEKIEYTDTISGLLFNFHTMSNKYKPIVLSRAVLIGTAWIIGMLAGTVLVYGRDGGSEQEDSHGGNSTNFSSVSNSPMQMEDNHGRNSWNITESEHRGGGGSDDMDEHEREHNGSWSLTWTGMTGSGITGTGGQVEHENEHEGKWNIEHQNQNVAKLLMRLEQRLTRLEKVRTNIENSNIPAARKDALTHLIDSLIALVNVRIAELNGTTTGSGSDITPPSITDLTLIGISGTWSTGSGTTGSWSSDTGAILSFTSSETGTGYYVVLQSGSGVATPSPTQVKLWQDSGGQPATLSGSFATSSGTNVFEITGLDPTKQYTVYFVAADLLGNLETMVHVLIPN